MKEYPEVIITEDDPATVAEISVILNKHGFGVSAVAENLQEAVSRIREKLPDILLIDADFEEYQEEIDKAVKTIDEYNIPAVYLTSFSDISVVDRYNIKSPSVYICKPVKEAELLAAFKVVQKRHEAEKSLKDKAERLIHALDTAADGFWDYDVVSNNIYYSPDYYKILGYNDGKNVIDLNTWENFIESSDLEGLRSAYNTCIEKKQDFFEVELRMKARSGKWKWFQIRGKVMKRTDAGRATSLVGTYAEVTECRVETDWLKLQARKLDILNQIISAVSKSNNFGYTMEKILDLTTSMLDLDAGAIYLISDDRSKNAQIVCSKNLPDEFIKVEKSIDINSNTYSPVYIGGEPVIIQNYEQVQSAHVMKFGFYSLACIPILDANKVIGSLNFISKKTKAILEEDLSLLLSVSKVIGGLIRKIQTEDALRESEEQYRSVINNIDEYVYSVYFSNGIAKLTYHSPQCRQITGYSPEEYYSDENLWFNMVHKDDRNMVLDFFNDIKSNVNRESIQHRIVHKDGSVRWLLNSCSVRKDDNGYISRMDGFIIDITERKLAEEQLKIYATTDVMTGLLNRRAAFMILENKLNCCRKNRLSLSVSFIDLNNLKKVNDHFGHTEGNGMIIKAAQILKQNTRDTDVACRIGGDEFLLILPECNIEAAEKIMCRVNSMLDDYNMKRIKDYMISLSYGVEEYNEINNLTAEELVNKADEKMYNSKRLYKEEMK